jgi:DNA-binding PadR family transcriptional regulator
MQEVGREILLSFWKAHILHHAGEKPVHGQWIIGELRRHGYEISPGTLYPLLDRLAQRGWLKCQRDRRRGRRGRKDYQLTAKGKEVLKVVREQIEELYREVVVKSDRKKPAPRGGTSGQPIIQATRT